LWEKIPGITDQDLNAWEGMRAEEMRQSADMAARSFGVDPNPLAVPDDLPVEAAGEV
jgi:hypothetical protein